MCILHTAYYYWWAFLPHSRKCSALGAMPTVALASSSHRLCKSYVILVQFSNFSFIVYSLNACACAYSLIRLTHTLTSPISFIEYMSIQSFVETDILFLILPQCMLCPHEFVCQNEQRLPYLMVKYWN